MRVLRQFVFLTVLFSATTAVASPVTIPHEFQSNSTASASEVNANFLAAATGINDNDSRIATLEAAVNTLQATVAALQTENTALMNRVTALEAIDAGQRLSDLEDDLLFTLTKANSNEIRIIGIEKSDAQKLGDYLEIIDTSPADTAALLGPVVRITGANLQVVNGSGNQDTPNGLGNLLIGYNKFGAAPTKEFCSDGQYRDQADCEAASRTWAPLQGSGSHNLIGGYYNSFTQTGGIVFGNTSIINRRQASVLGGTSGESAGFGSVILAGTGHTVTGGGSVILGGLQNEIRLTSSLIVGGSMNKIGTDTSGPASGAGVILGGTLNTIGDGFTPAIVGGQQNTASHNFSVILGESSLTTDTQNSIEPSTINP